MKLVKFYKNKASEKARIGTVLALEDKTNIKQVGLDNGFISYDIQHQNILFMDLTGIEVEESVPPPINKKQARA